MMFTRLELFIFVIALVNVLAMLELVRRRQLREKYALLWLTVGMAGIILAVTRGLMDRLARAVGVAYGPTVVFVLAILFLLLVCVHLSLQVSRLEERTTLLAAELALLRAETNEDRE
jgi:hypothetical protein